MAYNQKQKPLIYAFVSRGTVILAEFIEFSGNFNTIAFQCLQKLPPTNSKFTYNCDAHTFKMIETGEKEQLMELLTERLMDCGWKDEMKDLCSISRNTMYTMLQPRLDVLLFEIVFPLTCFTCCNPSLGDLEFTFLEMNPFTLVDGKPYPLDMRG